MKTELLSGVSHRMVVGDIGSKIAYGSSISLGVEGWTPKRHPRRLRLLSDCIVTDIAPVETVTLHMTAWDLDH
ncbi:hypothetical protein [Methylobacterium sp. CM6247]